MKQLEVPSEYLVGRILAHDVVDKDSGEIVAVANDELTEESIEKLLDVGIRKIDTLFVNDLDRDGFGQRGDRKIVL